MKIAGEHVIDADRERVWKALNDTSVLKQCVPGCQDINWASDDELEAVVGSAVGPLKLTMKGRVKLSDVVPLERYTLTGSGNAGPAGHVTGSADVHLKSLDSGATQLTYGVSVTIGGKLAQVGSKLVEGTARREADQFFRCFTDVVSGRTPVARRRHPGLIIAAAVIALAAAAALVYFLG